MCQHQPQCPTSDASDREAAHVVSAHPEQGWSLLCNGVVLFDDSGQILPGGRVIRPRQWEKRPCPGERRDLPLAG
jgi:hypothetical protein